MLDELTVRMNELIEMKAEGHDDLRLLVNILVSFCYL